MTLAQLVYYSRNRTAAAERKPLDLMREVLAKSQRNNVRDGLTGFLLFDRQWFVQILEGEREAVSRTYERIRQDPRHGEVVLVGIRPTKRRSFPRWSMGGSVRTPEQAEIYLRHGVGSELDPAKLPSPVVIALAMDLQDHEAACRQAATAAAG